ncbi:response regulator transcription factor [Paenibacillus flagellatus]|uniref:Two-component system response regulator n=1 Tax=Paenibacillus flagellatus TaxID=2211139 RepID=A0A2V5K7E1_9BACL|nr:response regulator [Paenibacillus flagellatus]PYI53894.1 two-component system response regulator [Paenibacillus flagellatus]
MNLKALLVDDEINIMRNLQTVIPWERMGIDIVGMATNGAKALELIEERMPDLILSDIRMPVMDGIALLQQLQERQYEGEVIMLTGFQEFDYARSAVKYGAKDYILKPIDYEELQSIVERLAQQIRERRAAKRNEEKKWRHLSTLAHQKILYDVLMDYASVSDPHLPSDDEEAMRRFDYTLLVADLDGYSRIARPWNERERKLWNFAVRNVLQEALLPRELDYAVLQTREGEWCVLVRRRPGSPDPASDEVRGWCETLQQAVAQYVKLPVSVGIYPCPVPMEALAESYKCVQRALQLSPEKQQVLLVDNRCDESETEDESLWPLVDELVAGLKQCDRARTEQATRGLNASVKAILAQSVLRGEQILHFVVLHLMREMREVGMLEGSREDAVWAKLEKSVSVKELLCTIDELVQECLNARVAKKTSELLMMSAKDYIHRHLGNDLGIEELADHLGISCSYFSLLFKQQYGETFVEYVTRQRMETAKSLLLMTDKSVTQIGKTVGYAERRYFTKVFHKFWGMTPTELREKSGGPGSGKDESFFSLL